MQDLSGIVSSSLVFQLLNHVRLFATPLTAARQPSLSVTISQSLLKLMSIESVMPFNHLICCCSLLLLPLLFPSIRSFPGSHLFTSGGQSIGSLTLGSDLPMDIKCWFPLGSTGLISLQSKETLLQSTDSPAPQLLQHSAFFMVQLSNLYMMTRKNSLTVWTFFGKVMSLLFNMLSRFVIAFLPRSKHLLILWLQSPSTVILEPRK